MSIRDVKKITRTVTVSDLTPKEMASIFAEWFDDKQAAFFNALAVESKNWPGGGFGGQMYAMSGYLDEGGRRIVDDIIDNCKSQ